MLNIKDLLLIITLLSCYTVYADLDLDDYNLTMAREELKQGNVNKAENYLQEVGASKEKEKLSKEIAKTRDNQKKHAAEKKLKQEKEELLRKEMAAQKRLEEKEALERERPELLKKSLCDCFELKKTLEVSLSREKAAAQYSGLINKDKVYNLGQSLHLVDLKISKIKNEMSSRRVTEGGCDSYTNQHGYLCYDF